MVSAESVQKERKRNKSLFSRTLADPEGWTRSSLSGLCSCGASAALRPLSTALFLVAFVLQNTLLDPIKGSSPFSPPIPPTKKKSTFLVEKRAFPRSTCLEWIAVFPVFLSSIHEERTDAHVNTGNDTSKIQE